MKGYTTSRTISLEGRQKIYKKFRMVLINPEIYYQMRRTRYTELSVGAGQNSRRSKEGIISGKDYIRLLKAVSFLIKIPKYIYISSVSRYKQKEMIQCFHEVCIHYCPKTLPAMLKIMNNGKLSAQRIRYVQYY